uniref:Si:ch211-191d15.2 n=1 Tax=Scleropages formosus TaxID=113540 RepID=A0A8C9W557_SCLFO
KDQALPREHRRIDENRMGCTELSLSHNWLVNFPKGLPPSLRSLQLQENRITYLTAGGLRQLGNLTRLDLEGNRIRFIQPGAFLGLRKLQILGLKENRLVGFPISLPASLIRLDLSANCISSLDLTSLAPLVNLQVLKVNSNLPLYQKLKCQHYYQLLFN